MGEAQNADVSNVSENDISSLLSSLSNMASSSEGEEKDLLSALRPLLSQKRQKKIDQCEKFITLANTIKLFSALNIASDDEKEV